MQPNADSKPRPEAEAKRTLEGVSVKALLGVLYLELELLETPGQLAPSRVGDVNIDFDFVSIPSRRLDSLNNLFEWNQIAEVLRRIRKADPGAFIFGSHKFQR